MQGESALGWLWPSGALDAPSL